MSGGTASLPELARRSTQEVRLRFRSTDSQVGGPSLLWEITQQFASRARPKLLPVDSLIEFPRGTPQFLGRHVPPFFGTETKRGPIGLALGTLIEVVKVVVAARCPNEESASLPVGERRPQHFLPGGRSHGGELIEHHEIETFAPQRIVRVGPAQGDRTASREFDPQITLLWLRSPVGPRELFQSIPGDPFRLPV